MHIRFHPHRPRRRRARDRRGAILIWFALLLIILMAMAGMVIDVGRLMAAQRQAQNAADAAAMAVADDVLIQNRSHLAAITTERQPEIEALSRKLARQEAAIASLRARSSPSSSAR